MLLISRISAMSLARNNGASTVPFMTISVCIVFVVNALMMSMIRRV
jgi:hypothetical protein